MLHLVAADIRITRLFYVFALKHACIAIALASVAKRVWAIVASQPTWIYNVATIKFARPFLGFTLKDGPQITVVCASPLYRVCRLAVRFSAATRNAVSFAKATFSFYYATVATRTSVRYGTIFELAVVGWISRDERNLIRA